MRKESLIILYKNLLKKLMIELDEEIYFLYSPIKVFRSKEKLEDKDYFPIFYFNHKEENNTNIEIDNLDKLVNIENINKNYEIMTASQIIREIKIYLENNN